MPSNARRRSSNSLVVKSNNESAVASAVRAWAAQVVSRHTEVTRIIWFGSRVHGHPVPSSDVDVCIVLSHSNEPVRDRASKYLPFGFPVGIDAFAYTEDELEQLATAHPSWHAAIVSGKTIAPVTSRTR